MARPPVSLVLGDNDVTRPLVGGQVPVGDLAIEHLTFEPIHKAFKPMLREQRFDVSEVAIIVAIQAVAYGVPVVVLPITVAARFQHKCAIYDTRRGRVAPRDLIGKKVGVRSYTQTTGAWVRAILAREYGVRSDSIEWITIEDPHVAQYVSPDNVVQVSADHNLLVMLENGEIAAAIFGNDLPKLDWIGSVIPDPEAAALRAFQEDGVVPVNHTVVASKAFAQERPDDLRTLYDAFKASKAVAKAGHSGPDLRPIGFAAMRNSISVFLDEAHDQKLLPRPMTFDELFADAVAILGPDA